MRVVVKIGTTLLTTEQGALDYDKLRTHADIVAALKVAGHEVVVVSSGSIGAGFGRLGLSARPTKLKQKQASAAVGQGVLVHAYSEAFRSHEITVGQVLLVRDHFFNRRAYENAFHTLSELIRLGAVPVINENDTVAVEEVNFGDNDMLSALVAGLIGADMLVILTEVGGLYSCDPRSNEHAELIRQVDQITPELEALAAPSTSRFGTGGMQTKLQAVKMILSLGIPAFIGCAQTSEEILNVILGEGEGTYCGNPGPAPLKRKKQWIAFHSEVAGKLVVDAGAERALLHRGSSLLPAGVRVAQGSFEAGAVVEVHSERGEIIGKGVVNYSSVQLTEALGKPSEYAKQELDVEREEVVHRDDWVTLAPVEVSSE